MKQFLLETKIDRRTFLGVFLLILAVNIAYSGFVFPNSKLFPTEFFYIFLFLVVPLLVLMNILAGVFRLRDIGLSRWLAGIILIPYVNFVFNLFLVFKKGKI